MPDITPAQIAAVLTFVVSQVVAWGWIDNNAGQRLVSVGGIVVAAVWKLADAYLRGERVKAAQPAPHLDQAAPTTKA
jgi:hypothetical protein